MPESLIVNAFVTVKLEVKVGSWGDGCTMEQIYKQASDSALDVVRSAIGVVHNSIKIVGDPKVETITTTRARP